MDLLTAFQIFVRVSETGSFSAVARDLGLSQPAISRQIAALEEHFGERLFQRTTRNLTLTDDGRDLLTHASRVLETLAEAETAVGKRRGTVAGSVRLSVPATFGRLYLAPRLGELLALHPALEIELLLSDSLADLVADGIDLAIRAGAIADSTLIARKLSAVMRCAIASAEYLARHGTPQTPAELAQHECLIFTQGAHPYEWQFEGPSGLISIPVRGRLRSDAGDAIREAVISGHGIAMLPAWYLRDELQDGRVKIILQEWQVPPTPVHLIYPSRRYLSPRVKVVMEFLLREFTTEMMFAKTQLG